MTPLTVFFIISVLIAVCETTVFIVKHTSFVSMVFTLASGLCIMAAVNVTTEFTGVNIPINFVTITISLLLGAPGIAGMIAIKSVL